MLKKFIHSWAAVDSAVTPTAEILEWVRRRNRDVCVDIRRVGLREMNDWFYSREEGVLRNRLGSFFRISGYCTRLDSAVVSEHPIILQPENGYLGIICKEIEGILHFLMQAKIEPGNINKIQISPTIQATKSNFTQLHGGRQPAYLDYFLNADRYQIILDQLQSEQSSRFLHKRNRNILIYVGDDEVEQLDSHRWMTLGQIKDLMCRFDNLVNMDTRTVLSAIPYWLAAQGYNDVDEWNEYFSEKPLMKSVLYGSGRFILPKVYNYLNNYKMFDRHEHRLVPLHDLSSWQMTDDGVSSYSNSGFDVIYCQIEIEGREVRKWTQPLFRATGISTFGLICSDIDGVRHFLVRAKAENGCFDRIELGPTVQLDAADQSGRKVDYVDQLLDSPLAHKVCDVMLSEEGGRFYHEQNRNVIVYLPYDSVPPLPDGCFWMDYRMLSHLCQINNCLNIQLRNLLSLLRISL